MRSLQQVLLWLSLALEAGLLLRLVTARLHRSYIWFFVLICLEFARGVATLLLNPRTNFFAYSFMITETVKLFLCILVVLEIYSLALRGHQGIATLSRWVLTGAVLVAVGISALTLSADLSGPAGKYPYLVYYSVIERGLLFSLVLFLLLITAFLVWSPIAVRRNVVLHASIFSFYFLSSALTLFVRNLKGYEQTRTVVGAALFLIQISCYVFWIAFLNKQGEEKVVVVRRSWDTDDEVRLTEQLDAINAFLLKTARK
jgi:hypothetical protein